MRNFLVKLGLDLLLLTASVALGVVLGGLNPILVFNSIGLTFGSFISLLAGII